MTDMIKDTKGLYVATKVAERLQDAEENLDYALTYQHDHYEIFGPVETEHLNELVLAIRTFKERIDASISEFLETSE